MKLKSGEKEICSFVVHVLIQNLMLHSELYECLSRNMVLISKAPQLQTSSKHRNQVSFNFRNPCCVCYLTSKQPLLDLKLVILQAYYIITFKMCKSHSKAPM